MQKCKTISVGKPEGKINLGRPGSTWDNSIRMHLKVVAWKSVDWIHLAEDRGRLQAVVNAVMNSAVEQKARGSADQLRHYHLLKKVYTTWRYLRALSIKIQFLNLVVETFRPIKMF
jgi:hypothetical protein